VAWHVKTIRHGQVVIDMGVRASQCKLDAGDLDLVADREHGFPAFWAGAA
jgi:hypothetical protein